MQVVALYRYKRADGGVTVSPVKPEGEYTAAYRLIADEGMILAHEGRESTGCVDVDSADGWEEIPYTENDDHGEGEATEWQ